MRRLAIFAICFIARGLWAESALPTWETANPILSIPTSPLGIDGKLTELKDPPTPTRVRLGRWLFYDKRLSADNSISCASCHRPENAFSEPSPHSKGIRGQEGNRKAPSFLNLAWTIYPNFFWDGRSDSLENQALGPMANPLEMGNSHEAMVKTLKTTQSYSRYFKEAFGDGEITKERVAKAIADYERTRMSGNSPWDKWKAGDERAVSDEIKLGDSLFSGKAACNQCHLGQNFTDNTFHNLGIGWNAKQKRFSDDGRFVVSKDVKDTGAFKTPTLRDVSKHAPYMHDGSLKTLKDVVNHYNKGGDRNPHLDPKMAPLKLSKREIKAIVALMNALNGEGYMDTPPKEFPH